MTISISLTPEAETKLRHRAARLGQDLSIVASDLLEEAVRRPSVDELLAPARKQVAESGMTDETSARPSNELLKQLRECFVAIDAVIQHRPMLAAMRAGSTTLGNRRAEAKAVIERAAVETVSPPPGQEPWRQCGKRCPHPVEYGWSANSAGFHPGNWS